MIWNEQTVYTKEEAAEMANVPLHMMQYETKVKWRGLVVGKDYIKLTTRKDIVKLMNDNPGNAERLGKIYRLNLYTASGIEKLKLPREYPAEMTSNAVVRPPDVVVKEQPIESVVKINSNMVDGRSLHEWLQVGTAYKDWFPRMVEYGFIEGVDFRSKMSETPTSGGRPSINHEMTIEMAKHLCMIQRTERGKQARDYFLECEKIAKQAQKPMTQAELIAAQANLAVELERRQAAIEAKQEAIEAKQESQAKEIATMKEIFCIQLDNWQDDCNKIVRYVGQKRGGGQDTYRDAWREVYEVFSARYHVDLPARKKNWLKRMKEAGATKTAMKNLTFLTIIDSDPRLREGLITVVKEFAIKEGVTMTANHEVIEFKVVGD